MPTAVAIPQGTVYNVNGERREPMVKTASAIRFAPEEKAWIAAFAELSGKSFSAQVREWTLERLEDELDARDLAEAIEQARIEGDTGDDWDDIKDRWL